MEPLWGSRNSEWNSFPVLKAYLDKFQLDNQLVGKLKYPIYVYNKDGSIL